MAKGYLPEIFEIETCLHGDDWEESERFWIENFRTLGCRLLNLAAGGGGTFGHRATEEQRRARSVMRTGYVLSAETKLKIGRANRGRPHTERQRAMNSAAKRGEKSPTAKLTANDIPVIRALRAAGYSGSQVASLYGITKQNCDDIYKLATWSHVLDQDVDISGIVVPPIRRLRGAENGTAKLNDAAVRDIRRRLEGRRETGKALAAEYGVSTTIISGIRKRHIWRHVA